MSLNEYITDMIRVFSSQRAKDGTSEHAERLEILAQGRACYLRRQWREAQTIFLQ